MTVEAARGYSGISEDEYKSRIKAWTMYDWANSAFATTILAAVLPVYYSQVAGATLPSAAKATQYWSVTLSISLVIVAIISPILGTVADLTRSKKRFLSWFLVLGLFGTAALVIVDTGDWLIASILLIVARIGFGAGNVFYDSLLPHVARDEDQDRISARGYAMGYLGGGILLAINVVMIFVLPDNWGPRLSFFTVAVWWAIFSFPILRKVPEPPSASTDDREAGAIIRTTFARLANTFRSIRRYRHLFRYLVAFLIYNDGIGTIIAVAAIYGAELGFGSVELILAILLVQFVGFPFTMIFGGIPSRDAGPRRPVFLAFVLWNLVMLPIAGIYAAGNLDADVVGASPPDFVATATAAGQGEVELTDATVTRQGSWSTIAASQIDGSDNDYSTTSGDGAEIALSYVGQQVEVTHSEGPNHADIIVLVDGSPLLDEDGDAVIIKGFRETQRFDVRTTLDAHDPGTHTLTLVASASAAGADMQVAAFEVKPPVRSSNLLYIIGGLLALQAVGYLLSRLFGPRFFSGLADTMTTKRTIIMALLVYSVIAVWGFFLDAVVEFWFLAWMVAVVQGGSQALSRSLYSSMSPASESGEFFGLFSIMSKFSAIVGPFVFAFAVAVFGNSRPAILSLIVFFVVGIALLLTVDVEEGRRVAAEADAELVGAT